MHKNEPKSISLEDAKKILDFLSENKFLVAYFTGGEPTLHPNLFEIVRYANELGLITSVTTNGTNPNKIKELNKFLYVLSVSLDHWNPEICEKIRGFKNIQMREIETIKNAKECGIPVYALTFLNPYLDNIGRMVDFVNNKLGVPFGFCYPTFTNTNSYRLSGTESSQLSQITKQLLEMKKRKTFKTFRKHDIANPYFYLRDISNFLEGKTPEVFCNAGEGVVYIDWNGDVFPCFIRPKLFNIHENDKKLMEDVRCNQCLINCFREPSGLAQLTLGLAIKETLYRSSVYIA